MSVYSRISNDLLEEDFEHDETRGENLSNAKRGGLGRKGRQSCHRS